MSKTEQTERVIDSDDLMTEPTPRQVSANTQASLRVSVPRGYADHIDLGAGAAVQFSVHDGRAPVVVDSPCLIIEAHPCATGGGER